MKRILAVTLLLMSFASVALVDGPGTSSPGKSTKLPNSVLLADGPGCSPPGCGKIGPSAAFLR